MSDMDETTERPGAGSWGVPEGGFALGGLAAGEADTTLGAEGGEAGSAAPEDLLIVPRGALVVLRKSGGLRFTSRSCVVYRSGRVERGSLAEGPARATHLSAAEMGRLRHLLLRARLASWERERPAAAPDAYSYEIAARYGNSTRRVELADHHIPDAIAPLVRALSKLLP
jgi:hypothetical protein